MLAAAQSAFVDLATSGPTGYLLLAAAIGMYALIEFYIRDRRRRRLLESGLMIAALIFGASFGFIQGARTNDILVQKRSEPIRLTDRVSLALLDVRSLKGWGEGEGQVSGSLVTRGIPDKSVDSDVTAAAYDQILSDVRTRVTGAQIKIMDQPAWEAFLLSLPIKEREKLGARSWSHLRISVDGKVRDFNFVFKGQTLKLIDEGKTLGWLTVKHIFNVMDLISDDPESVIVDFKPA